MPTDDPTRRDPSTDPEPQIPIDDLPEGVDAPSAEQITGGIMKGSSETTSTIASNLKAS